MYLVLGIGLIFLKGLFENDGNDGISFWLMASQWVFFPAPSWSSSILKIENLEIEKPRALGIVCLIKCSADYDLSLKWVVTSSRSYWTNTKVLTHTFLTQIRLILQQILKTKGIRTVKRDYNYITIYFLINNLLNLKYSHFTYKMTKVAQISNNQKLWEALYSKLPRKCLFILPDISVQDYFIRITTFTDLLLGNNTDYKWVLHEVKMVKVEKNVTNIHD